LPDFAQAGEPVFFTFRCTTGWMDLPGPRASRTQNNTLFREALRTI
jgi:hypothetical protein